MHFYCFFLKCYSIKSKNTKRTFTGETFYDINLPNPQKQRIHLSDSWLEDYVLAVEFTEHELNATKTFCKGISEIISSKLNVDNTSDEKH